MSTLRILGVGCLLVAGCASSSRARPADDVSYTRMNGSTSVTVHPPPAVVSTTETTSADLPVTSAAFRDEAPGYGSADAQLTTRVRKELAQDRALDDAMLHVRAVAIAGRVLLSGSVPTLAEKVAVEQRVRETKDVTGVDNELQAQH